MLYTFYAIHYIISFIRQTLLWIHGPNKAWCCFYGVAHRKMIIETLYVFYFLQNYWISIFCIYETRFRLCTKYIHTNYFIISGLWYRVVSGVIFDVVWLFVDPKPHKAYTYAEKTLCRVECLFIYCTYTYDLLYSLNFSTCASLCVYLEVVILLGQI